MPRLNVLIDFNDSFTKSYRAVSKEAKCEVSHLSEHFNKRIIKIGFGDLPSLTCLWDERAKSEKVCTSYFAIDKGSSNYQLMVGESPF